MERGARWELLEVRLQGGAPWGFTVQGGLETSQPLLVSRVEKDGKAACVECPLLVGDELIIINSVELSGFRQEAIALVKGSHRTLDMTIRRDLGGCLLEDLLTPPCSPQSQPVLEESPGPQTHPVQLRSNNRRGGSSSRPHSWHSTKLGDGPPESIQQALDRMSTCHSSVTDLALGLDLSGGRFLRKSADQYSSRGSLESLEPAPGPTHRPLGPHSSSSCQQLSSKRSSSIDLLHSKRDSAYSSYSTSLSFPESLGLNSERSFSLESVPQTADRGHDMSRGYAPEQETSTRISFREHQEVGEACYHGSKGGVSSNRHSLGLIWCTSCESLKGAPAPPQRSDSYTVTHQDRPNSWSSLEHVRSQRPLQKGSWHHSSNSVVTSAKSLYMTEGQLHTVIEKSPESSPITRPRQALSPGPPQDPYCPTAAPLAVPSGVYPTVFQEKQNGYRHFSTATAPHNRQPESDRSFEQHPVHLDTPSRVAEAEVPHTKSPGYHQALPSHSPAHPQTPTTQLPIHHQAQPSHSSTYLHTSPSQSNVHSADLAHQSHTYSESLPAAAPLYCQPEHLLTRLEMALAEVQRGGSGPGENGPTRSLSVLEKVSHFEHQERVTKQRSLSSRHRSSSHRVSDKRQITPRGAEDLRNMLERSTSTTKAHRTVSHGRGSQDKFRSPADPNSALQRSRSSYNMEWSRKDSPHRQDVQESISTKSSRQDSEKDTQSTVSDSTTAPLTPPPVPLKQQTPVKKKGSILLPAAEKKGPKTLPKPQGKVFTPAGLSPHTPKEHFMVSPELRGVSPPTPSCEPPPLPSLPPVGPPALMRICGRKRLTSEQKRSFSEPEHMNEIGVTDPETTALLIRHGDTTVADRRRLFEQAAAGAECGAPVQDALLDFVERRRSEKRDDRRTYRRPRSSPRPHSALPQLLHSHTETTSLSSTSSLRSLQDCAPDMHFFPGEQLLSSSLARGGDLRSFQSNLFYPGRVTSPRPPAKQPPSSLQDYHTTTSFSSEPAGAQGKDVHQLVPASHCLSLSQELNSALQRAGPARHSGRCASAENLLEKPHSFSPQHSRSLSSPTGGTVEQDVRPFAAVTSEVERPTLAAHRAANITLAPEPVPPPLPEDPSSGQVLVAVLHRERSRPSSTLAASVGLHCPMSGSGAAEWTSSERLSQANLDNIAFPGQSSSSVTNRNETSAANRIETSEACTVSRTDKHSGSDFDIKNLKENREGTFILGMRQTKNSSSEADPEDWNVPFAQRQMSSLRISESNLQFDTPFLDQTDEYDEVFIHSPVPQDFPLAPPPVLLDSFFTESSRMTSTVSPPFFLSSSLPPPPSPETQSTVTPALPPPSAPSACQAPSAPPVTMPPSLVESVDSLLLEYEPVPVRHSSPEEQRVQSLSRSLVHSDRSLEPLLDTWGKSTVEVLEEIFSNSRLVNELPWQHRDSDHLDDRSWEPAAVSSEWSVDEHQILITRKVELCEAMRTCSDKLQKEKETLGDELRVHTELGNRVDNWVQECCKGNERDKYRVFIGDLERVVNLLLSLCGRLARMDRSLGSLQRQGPSEGSTELWDSLVHKRRLLLRQTEDALELKQDVERRQCVVHNFLRRSLDPSQLLDYRRLVSSKPSLLIGQRRLDDLLRQTEEQLSLLLDTLPLELTQARGWNRTGLVPSPYPINRPVISGPAHTAPSPVHLAHSATVTSV